MLRIQRPPGDHAFRGYGQLRVCRWETGRVDKESVSFSGFDPIRKNSFRNSKLEVQIFIPVAFLLHRRGVLFFPLLASPLQWHRSNQQRTDFPGGTPNLYSWQRPCMPACARICSDRRFLLCAHVTQFLRCGKTVTVPRCRCVRKLRREHQIRTLPCDHAQLAGRHKEAGLHTGSATYNLLPL